MRQLIRNYENFVDKLEENLNPGEHYYVRIKPGSKTYKHYIANDSGKPIFITDIDSNTFDEESYTCGENINSHTPVVLINNLLYKMDNTNLNHQFVFIGFTKQSGTTGNIVTIKTRIISLSGWGLSPNTQYIAGPNGTLLTNNSVPNTFTKVIGYSQDSNTLLIIKDYTPILKI